MAALGSNQDTNTTIWESNIWSGVSERRQGLIQDKEAKQMLRKKTEDTEEFGAAVVVAL